MIFILMVIAIIFPKTQLFVDEYTIPKWIAGVICINLYVFTLSTLLWKIKLHRLILSEHFVAISISLITLTEAIWGWIRLLISEQISIISGSFDNPSGYASCLSISLPFIIYYIKNITLKVVSMSLIISSVIMSQSRTGIICIIVILLIHVLSIAHIRHFVLKIASFLVIMTIFIGSLLFIKQNSSNGRFFIIQRSIEMIMDKPLFGFGNNGFETNYMKYQAHYFDLKPNAPEALVADNIKTPLNEYIYFTVNYGLTSLFILLAIIGGILWHCRNKRIPLTNPFKLSFIIILIFAFFSYPMYYPFTWFILCLDILYFFRDSILNSSHARIKIVSILGLLMSIYTLGHISVYISREIEWKNKFDYSTYLKSNKQIPLFQSVYSYKKKDSFFLYHYAKASLNNKEYHACFQLLKEREALVYDYYQAIIWGEYHYNQGNYTQAKKYYYLASCMCPSKFVPLYKIFNIYKILKDHENAQRMRELILNKQIKIDSKEIQQIRKAVRYS